MNIIDPVNGEQAAAQPVMSYQHGQPVYYGTDQAKALALQGLKNVAAAHGTHSPQWRSAVSAALGVLGPDYQAPQGSFTPAAIAATRARQQGFGQAPRFGTPDLSDPGIRAAVIAALTGRR